MEVGVTSSVPTGKASLRTEKMKLRRMKRRSFEVGLVLLCLRNVVQQNLCLDSDLAVSCHSGG